MKAAIADSLPRRAVHGLLCTPISAVNGYSTINLHRDSFRLYGNRLWLS
jgi:hypothetical protein